MCMESCVGRGRKGKRGGGGSFGKSTGKSPVWLSFPSFRQERNFESPFWHVAEYISIIAFFHTHPAPSPAKRRASEKFEQQKVKKKLFLPPHHQPHIRALQLHTRSQSAAVGRWRSWKKKFLFRGFELWFFPLLCIYGKGSNAEERKNKISAAFYFFFFGGVGGTQERGKEELIKIFFIFFSSLGFAGEQRREYLCIPKDEEEGLGVGSREFIEMQKLMPTEMEYFFFRPPLALPPLPHIYRGGI